MDKQAIQKLLELIREIVSESNTPWKEKAEAIKAEASDDELTALAEFSSWFE
jgi:hypothetical protein